MSGNYIPKCTWGGDHETLLRESAADRQQKGFGLEDAVAICARCRQNLSYELLKAV